MRKAGQFQTIFDMKYSYKLILVLCIIGLLCGCDIEEDDTPADAIDVLSVTGRILDHNNQPVKNIPVSFYFNYGNWFINYTLKKATSKTDENGIYKLTVYRKKEERSVNGEGSIYYIVPDLNKKKYFLTYIYETGYIEDFWIDRYHIIDDYVLWEAQYVKVIAKTKPKGAKRYEIECELERSVGGRYDKCIRSDASDTMGIKVPLHTDIKVPLHQDLKFTMTWDDKYKRTVFVKKDNLPKQIDLSYIPE